MQTKAFWGLGLLLLFSCHLSAQPLSDFEEGDDAITEVSLPVRFDPMDVFREYTTIEQVPKIPYERALKYLSVHEKELKNARYLTIIDFTQNSQSRRMYVIDRQTQMVETLLVAHGRNSDVNHDGMATQFSNRPGSLMSSLGFYHTAETYIGKHGLSLRLDGRSSTNSNARARAIVIHGAWYVNPDLKVLGRSSGCPALESSVIQRVISQLRGGSLIYAWAGQGQ